MFSVEVAVKQQNLIGKRVKNGGKIRRKFILQDIWLAEGIDFLSSETRLSKSNKVVATKWTIALPIIM
jgi:hypothetical protein